VVVNFAGYELAGVQVAGGFEFSSLGKVGHSASGGGDTSGCWFCFGRCDK
jgi:hypothetical protein